MGERFPVAAVTSVTEAPVQPCEAVCAAFSGWAGEVCPQQEKSATLGVCGPIHREPPIRMKWYGVRGSGTGKRPPFRWGKHRVRLYAVPHSPGQSPGTPLPLKGRKERNAEEKNGDHHSQDDAGG